MLRPGTTRWWCQTCQDFFETTLVHANIVRCPKCKRTVKAHGAAPSKVQGRGHMYQQNIGLELLLEAQQKGPGKPEI